MSAARHATAQSDWAAAATLLEEARDLFRDGRRREEVTALAYLGWVALRRDEPGEAETLCQEALSLARELGDRSAIASALMALGDVRAVQGDHDFALAQYEEAVSLRRNLGDPLLVADAIYNLGMVAFQGDDPVRARQAFEEALALARELDEAPYIAAAQFMLSDLDLLAGDTGSEHRVRESLEIYTVLEDDRSSARCLVVLAGTCTAKGRMDEAARYFGAADALRGSSAPDSFERPLLDRYLPQLEAALGNQRFSELRVQGAGQKIGVVARAVVSVGIEE